MSHSKDATPVSFACERHDHAECKRDALARVERVCAARGLRLTELRRRVLELVWASHMPMKAYDLLEKLQLERATAAPPTVYRALDFLVQEGFVHRIESLNAFIGCDIPERDHQGQFLICDNCGEAAELSDPDIEAALQDTAQTLGFRVDVSLVELKGRCARCVHA